VFCLNVFFLSILLYRQPGSVHPSKLTGAGDSSVDRVSLLNVLYCFCYTPRQTLQLLTAPNFVAIRTIFPRVRSLLQNSAHANCEVTTLSSFLLRVCIGHGRSVCPSLCLSVCLSVRPSVCHVPMFCPEE